jgi:cytoskeletal protein RodZ
MEETKMEKQNKMLKIILLLLMIPVIAGAAIAAFYFGQKMLNTDSPAAKDKDLPTVKRDDPFSGNSTASTSATPTVTASATPAATATPAAPKPVVEQSNFPLIGRWVETTNQGKIIMKFEAPKKIGNAEIGRVITTAEFGKEYESVYEVVSSNQYRLKDEQMDYYYVIEAGGKSLKLTYDGQSRYLTRMK